MAGPLIEAIRDRLSNDESQDMELKTVRERVRDGELLADDASKLNDKVSDGSGCCNVASAAEAVRREGKEYR